MVLPRRVEGRERARGREHPGAELPEEPVLRAHRRRVRHRRGVPQRRVLVQVEPSPVTRLL